MENKTSRYFKYAIGEIVLVVIGILIALQINNWNESRINSNKERLYLESFRADLLKNEEELRRVIDKSERITNRADSILIVEYRNDLLKDPYKFLRTSLSLQGFTIYLSKDGTVKDILGSNTLQIIKNDSLRRAIGTWESDLKSLREYEDLGKNSANDYSDYLKTKVDVYKLFATGNVRELAAAREAKIITQSNIDKLLQDRLYLNKVADRKLDSENLFDIYSTEILKVQRLLEHLNNELGLTND